MLANVSDFSRAPRRIETRYGALLRFLSMLMRLDLAGIAERCAMIAPPAPATLSLRPGVHELRAVDAAGRAAAVTFTVR